MTSDRPLVIAEEWQVVLLVPADAPARLVRGWCRLGRAGLVTAMVVAEGRMRTDHEAPRLRLDFDPWPDASPTVGPGGSP